MPATPAQVPGDAHDQLSASITDLGRSIDKANLRLDLTRQALRSLIDNDFAYLQLIASIDAAADEGRETLE